MKTPTITLQDRADIDAFRAEIRQRPGYAFARAWVDQLRLAQEPPTKYPTGIGRIGQAIELFHGVKLQEEILIVALEDAGIPINGVVRYRDGRIGGEVLIDEMVVLDVALQRIHGALPKPRPSARLWSDDDIGTVQ